MMDSALPKRRVCLIGGAGFIGHNLALRLAEKGAVVSIIDGLEVNNLLSITTNSDHLPHPELSLYMVNQRLRLLRDAGIQMFVQDAREQHALARLIDEIQPQTIVQLAGVSHANRSNIDPFPTFDHSFRTLENALEASRGKVEHFVYFSSSMVYGDFDDHSVTEDSPCKPLGIYGALKLSGELLVKAYQQVFDLPYTIVRPSALYGERCISRRVGQVFIENALRGKEITINGNGASTLDFTYIEDLLEGLIRVVEKSASRNETFNLTHGEARPINTLIDMLRGHFPNMIVQTVAPDRLMPERGTLSIEKARRLLGYEPAWPLEKGYAQYINWYKSIAACAVADRVANHS